MSDDTRLPIGAAAPTRARVVRSLLALDVSWVVLAGVAFVVSSFFSLVDLERESLQTSDPSLRVYAVVLPVVALLVAAGAAFAKSLWAAAAATGILAPSSALVGLVSSSLFLDRNAAYTDVGVAVSLLVALFGVATLIRWFVYHPVDLHRDEVRPTRRLAIAVAASAAITGVAISAQAIIDRGATTAQFAMQLLFALVVPITLIAAAIVRTMHAFVLAGTAAVGQVVAVLLADLDADIGFGSDRMLWTTVAALAALIVSAGLVAASVRVNGLDVPNEVDIVDDESWRWTAED